ncbi:hypothetical protein KR51_00006550 [Rubidibacter lacunae KORDI 51-2]|uniref:Uncharacterized protein n=1 Tax=Rubidibacter lacunae KORDI 51-2 TaxID=582515 RepID=U5DDP4_9CHRO|nr:hypothetical protein [Rubidibacter lacunae]ERN42628.1 hypothetical protein KR51_00006550 [Rubidibacter lacunae KORDI 51-2]
MGRKARTEDGLSYRDFQRRNSKAFKILSADRRKLVKSRGYRNLGWDSVIASWNILQDYLVPQLHPEVASLPEDHPDRVYAELSVQLDEEERGLERISAAIDEMADTALAKSARLRTELAAL